MLSLMGCAGISWNPDLGLGGANEAGYQFAKHFPTYADEALGYAQAALDANEPMTFQEQFDKWMDYVLEKAGADAHLKRQINRFKPIITLPEGSTPDMEWMLKARPYLQEFIYGIEDAREVILQSTQAYKDSYRAKLTAKLQAEHNL